MQFSHASFSPVLPLSQGGGQISQSQRLVVYRRPQSLNKQLPIPTKLCVHKWLKGKEVREKPRERKKGFACLLKYISEEDFKINQFITCHELLSNFGPPSLPKAERGSSHSRKLDSGHLGT